MLTELREIFIVINEKYKIIYTNLIDKNQINNFMEYINIKDSIKNNKYNLQIKDKFYVNIDERNYNNEKLYFITIYKKIKEDVLSMLYKDTLTGLYNRNLWEKIINKEINLKTHSYNALAIIDIDNFKLINDKFGHFTGDKYIKLIAYAIKGSIGEHNLAFRYGGDEFIILFYEKTKKNLYKDILNIKMNIEKYLVKKKIKISIGGTFFEGQNEMKKAFKNADYKLYKEKQLKHYKSNKVQLIN